MNEVDWRDSFRLEIERDVRRYVRLRRTNGFLAEAFIWLTIVVSFILTVITATEPTATVQGTSIRWIVLLSPLPGIFGLIRASIGFDRRTAWFSKKATWLNTIRRKYIHGIVNKEQAIQEVNAIDTVLESNWQELLLRETLVKDKADAETVEQGGTRPPKGATGRSSTTSGTGAATPAAGSSTVLPGPGSSQGSTPKV